MWQRDGEASAVFRRRAVLILNFASKAFYHLSFAIDQTQTRAIGLGAFERLEQIFGVAYAGTVVGDAQNDIIPLGSGFKRDRTTLPSTAYSLR